MDTSWEGKRRRTAALSLSAKVAEGLPGYRPPTARLQVGPVFWCFRCYALNDHASGPCTVCGEPVEVPAGLSRVDSLIWALGHPDGDRALLAAGILGRLRARESVPALRAAVQAGNDIYVRAEALRSLIVIEGVESLRPWLEELSRVPPVNVRNIARRALARQARDDPT
jgi:HEAT repeat protein